MRMQPTRQHLHAEARCEYDIVSHASAPRLHTLPAHFPLSTDVAVASRPHLASHCHVMPRVASPRGITSQVASAARQHQHDVSGQNGPRLERHASHITSHAPSDEGSLSLTPPRATTSSTLPRKPSSKHV
ncbi:hypothetical protein K438DRAFT_1821659 [Mycena galopus ATCC 62051]|nr:hypothetical protein K438DRAFT_1821659 [Mycena galopus ATCC 62051]